MDYVKSVRPSLKKQSLLKFLKSKFVVLGVLLLTIFGSFGMLSQTTKADDSDNIATVYQYFLLKNRSSTSKQSFTDKMMKGILGQTDKSGILGSGGASGTFGYQELIDNSKDKTQAKRFSELMATLSYYNYISTQGNGFALLLSYVGRFFVGLILTILGAVMDIMINSWYLIINFLAKWNVFNLIGGTLAKSKTSTEIVQALGLNADSVQWFITTFLVLGVTTLVATFAFAVMKRGMKDADYSKVKGRIIGLLLVPISMMAGFELLSDITSYTSKDDAGNTPFASYLMDVKTWAEKYNFDLTVANVKTDGKTKGFVMTKYNPYSGFNPVTGQSASDSLTQTIFHSSDMSKGLFPNTNLAIDYLSSKVFDGYSYISYLQGEQSKKDGAYGSISSLIDSKGGKWIYDFDKPYSSTGIKLDDDYLKQNPMSKAKDDYVGKIDDEEKNVKSLASIWTDRYIYGYKNEGSKIEDYYKEGPSGEQISAAYGRNDKADGTALSVPSMFYVLNTHWNEQGGTFSISSPPTGAFKDIAKFADDRAIYYDVSMVGVPFFSVCGLIAIPLFTVLVFVAAIEAFLAMGVLDMNMRPLRAWMLAIIKGDYEYSVAVLVYGLGLVGSIIMATVVPNMLIKFFTGSLSGIFSRLSNSADNGSMSGGIGLFFTAFLAIIFWVAYVKNASGIRDKLTGFIMLPWTWASSTGQSLEDQANGGAKGLIGKGAALRNQKRERAAQRNRNMMDTAETWAAGGGMKKTRFGRKLDDLTGNRISGAQGKLSRAALLAQHAMGNYAEGVTGDDTHTAGENNLERIKRLGLAQRQAQKLAQLSRNAKNGKLGVDDKASEQIDDKIKNKIHPNDLSNLENGDALANAYNQIGKADEKINKDDDRIKDLKKKIAFQDDIATNPNSDPKTVKKAFAKKRKLMQELDKVQQDKKEHQNQKANLQQIADETAGKIKFNDNVEGLSKADTKYRQDLNKEVDRINAKQADIDKSRAVLNEGLEDPNISDANKAKLREQLQDLDKQQEALDNAKAIHTKKAKTYASSSIKRAAKMNDPAKVRASMQKLAQQATNQLNEFVDNPDEKKVKVIAEDFRNLKAQMQRYNITPEEIGFNPDEALVDLEQNSSNLPDSVFDENALAIDENGLTDYAADYGRRNMIRRKGSIDSNPTPDGSTLGDVMKSKVNFETKAPKEFNNADKLAQQVQQMRRATPKSGNGIGGSDGKTIIQNNPANNGETKVVQDTVNGGNNPSQTVVQGQNNPEQTIIRRNANNGETKVVQDTVSGGNNPSQTVVQGQNNPEQTIIRRNANNGEAKVVQDTVSGGNNPTQTVVQGQNNPEQTIIRHNANNGEAKVVQDVVSGGNNPTQTVVQGQNNPEQTIIRRNANNGETKVVQDAVSGGNNPSQTVVQGQNNPEQTIIRHVNNGGTKIVQDTVSGGSNPTQSVVQEQKAPEQTIIKHNVNAGKEIQNVVDNSPQTKADYSVDDNPKQNLDGLNQNNHVNLDNNPSDDLGK